MRASCLLPSTTALPANKLKRGPKPSRRQPPEPAEVRIERIGSEGDGVARLADGTPLYLPLTLPDEQVSAHRSNPAAMVERVRGHCQCAIRRQG